MSINLDISYPTPPYEYLLLASKHCPKAVYTYLNLWKQKDEESNVFVHKDRIFQEYVIDKRKFKQDLLHLAYEGLANVDETPNNYKIELLDWNEMED